MMKNSVKIFLPLIALVVAMGCAAGKGQYNPVTQTYDTNAVASALVVTAEKTRESTLEAFDLLMKEEFDLNAQGKSPKVLHDFSENIRKNGKSYLTDLTNAKVAYQTTRNAQTEQKLVAALSSVSSLLSSVQKYLTQIIIIKGGK